MTQAQTSLSASRNVSELDETSRNLMEAVSLNLEGEDPTEFGLVAKPSLSVTFELQPEYA